MKVEEAELADLVKACRGGERRAASRLISLLESSDQAAASAASDAVASLPLPSQTIAFTGPPGSGKSTLVDYIVGLYRLRTGGNIAASGTPVAVLAVDPSSPFTGGALLGDRIRMSSLRNDSGVFIRSMGSRGAVGGLAAAASDALRVLAGAGYETIFLETIGAGQAEIDVVNLADTICVVQVAGLGDDIQLMKMGILEIADIFVVNRGDKPEAKELQRQLEMAIAENHGQSCRALRQLGTDFAAAFPVKPWVPPVVLLSALRREHGEELLSACEEHRQYLRQPALAEALHRNRAAREILWRAGRRITDQLRARLEPGGDFAAVADACARGALSVDQAVAKITNERLHRGVAENAENAQRKNK